jgi:hypothetical protein
VVTDSTLLYGSECWAMRVRDVEITYPKNLIPEICKGMHKGIGKIKHYAMKAYGRADV